MVNPYSVSSKAPLETGVFGDFATRRNASFLYRVVDLQHPIEAEFVYDGWWFRQKIAINGVTVWWKVSWLWIGREAVFQLPQSVDSQERYGRIEIDFGRGLRFRRFRIWIDDELVYDEVT